MSATAVQPDRIRPRTLAAFLAMVFGMFMAILDIQIVSASLVEIQAGLAASADEIAYVQTSYLIAEVIMIPLSGFLARIVSTRWMFAASAAGFTAASVLCGSATSIEEMVVYRALQGFLGGGMIPTTFAASYAMFPLTQRQKVMPLMGLVVPMAPTIGPTVGGLLTDAFSWHWLFYVNVVPGIVVTVMAVTLIDYDKPNWALFRKFDWWGLVFMAVFLGCTEYVLEEGPIRDWFTDDSVVVFALGLSLTVAPLTSTVLSAGGEAHAGVSSAVNNAVARIGGLIAVAVIPAAAGISATDAFDVASFSDGFARGMLIAAAVCAAGGALAAATIRNPTPKAGEQPAPWTSCPLDAPPLRTQEG